MKNHPAYIEYSSHEKKDTEELQNEEATVEKIEVNLETKTKFAKKS